MIASALVTAYAANEWYQLEKIVDAYPEKLSFVIKKIKESIDQKTYDFLTNEDCDEKPNNPAIESINGRLTKVVTFKESPDFIVKTSKVGLQFDLSKKSNEELLGGSYIATNDEGGVTRDLFRFARRVIVAKNLRKIIKENHLDKIKVPKKYLCSYPNRLVPPFSTPFYNRKVFILCEKCDVEYVGEKTREELKKMSTSEMEILANQIHIFFSKSGILDFLPANYYIKEGKLVIFDTEPMSLPPLHLFCVSPALRVARINFKNLERNFNLIPEAKILVDEAERSIKQIRAAEKQLLPRTICITLLFLSAMLFLSLSSRIIDRRV